MYSLFSLVDTLPERIPEDDLEHGSPLHGAVLLVKAKLVIRLIRLFSPFQLGHDTGGSLALQLIQN